MFSIYSRNEVMRTYPERISKNKETTKKNFYIFQLARVFLHYLKSLHPLSTLSPLKIKNWQLEHFIRSLPAGEEKTYSYKEFPYAYAGIEKPSRITTALLQSGEKRHHVFHQQLTEFHSRNPLRMASYLDQVKQSLFPRSQLPFLLCRN